jgi:cobalt-zinc-cadmium efflux system outer membrane protein
MHVFPFICRRPALAKRLAGGLRSTLAVGGLLLASPALAAAELALTPVSAVQLALAQNRELQAARFLVLEAEARTQNAGKLPNPELETEFAGGRNFDGRIEVGFTQRFPLTARLRLARTLSELEVELARLETAACEHRLAADVQVAVVELIAAREALALSAQQLGFARAFSESQSAQAREGTASSLDAGQSRLAVRELEVQLAASRVEETEASARFATLLGVSAETTLTLPATLELPPQPPAAQASGRRPDLRLAELAVEAGDAGIALARTAKWEDIGVGVFVEGERSRDESGRRDREGLLGVRVSMPLPLWQKGDAQIAEKRASRDRFARQLEAFKLTVSNEALSAFRAMSARYEAARSLADELLPAVRQQLADTEAARARGEIDSQPVFRAREQLIANDRAALEARKAFHLARIQWLAATGNILPSP